MIINVADQSQLAVALSVANGGDTIRLAPGDYTGVKLLGYQFDKPVVITSADAGRPAVLDGVTFQDVSNIVLRNLDVRIDVGDSVGLSILNGTNIVLDHLDIYGTGTPLVGTGVQLRGGSDIEVVSSEFHHLVNGLSFSDAQWLTVSNNTFRDLRIDGIHGGGASNLEISDNVFTDFNRVAGDHGDAIQLWTSNTTVSAHDITISDNLITRGDGGRMQGIFISDQSGGKLPYQNVTVTGNTVLGGAYHGITVYDANNVVASNNTVIGFTDMKSWIRFSEVGDGKLTGNVTTQVSLGDRNPNLVNAGNEIVGQITASMAETYINAWLANHPGFGADLTPRSEPVDAFAASTSTVGEELLNLVVGDGENNAIVGTDGADVMDGRNGADTMTGGGGDDLYILDSLHDKVVEGMSAGVDTVRTKWSFKLGANVENLEMTGTNAQTGTGNDLDNTIRANGAKSTLLGGAGDDTLISSGGLDTLTGGAGRDMFSFEELPLGQATITDFTSGEDVLDLRPLLGGFHGADPVAEGWVKFQSDGAGATLVSVDVDGAEGPADFAVVAKLAGVTSALTMNTDWLFSDGAGGTVSVDVHGAAGPADFAVVAKLAGVTSALSMNTGWLF